MPSWQNGHASACRVEEMGSTPMLGFDVIKMTIKLFNTMGRKKQTFEPLKKRKVGLYSCGPTVYDYAHIGHFRAYVFVDLLKHVLEFNKLKVKHVMNITDVGHLISDADTGEDKMEMSARREKKTVWQIAEFYTKDFFDAMKKLNVLKPSIICKATNHIEDMIDLVKRIEKNGYAYITSDGIYFDTSKLKDYGKLAQLDIEGLKAGARIDLSPEKRNPTDFALWKFSPKDKKRQMEWKSPWGVGFPGWHIECSAMSMKYLGETFDIHTGGVDHINVHHTNEIAQAEAATGKPFVRYWLHNEFVLVEGEKMSKSKGNFYNMQDIENKGFDPLALRYLFLTTHYRSKMNFTWDSLEAAQNALETLREHMRLLQEPDKKKSDKRRIEHYKKEFLKYINDDLNTPMALSSIWELIREEERINNKDKCRLMIDFDRVLGLRLKDVKKFKEKLPKEIQDLIRKREQARKKKDWKTSDKTRAELRKKGIILEDTEKGVRWKKLI